MSIIFRLLWRAFPVALVIYGTRTGVINWTAYYHTAVNSVAVVTTHLDMATISRALLEQYNAGMGLPHPRRFDDWLIENIKASNKDTDVDHFGNPYRLHMLRDGYEVISAGPDGEYDTDDDITKTVRGLDGV